MKRAVTGGTYRGPVALRRQARTIRFVQVLLVLVAGGLMAFAGYSYAADQPIVQVVVIMILGGVAIGAAGALSDGRAVRVPIPARLEELAGRAERAAIERAEEAAGSSQT
jgi:uncharacterized protein YwlG (UPF0340 family)